MNDLYVKIIVVWVALAMVAVIYVNLFKSRD